MFDFVMGGRTGGQVKDLFTQRSLTYCFKNEFVDLYKLANHVSKETVSFLVSWAIFRFNLSSSA